MIRFSFLRRSAIPALTALLLGACATQPPGGSVVEQRAQQRWDALLASDYDTAYGFYSPGYRSSTSRVDFEISLRTRRIAWIAADVQESECSGDSCTVVSKVRYRAASPVPGVPKWENDRRMEERWVRTNGQWWYVPDV